MPSHFTLTLDTRAPVVTWGAVDGATAGELLRVGYTLDEPALISGTIRLADGRTLPLDDTGLTLEALLPPDTPDGNATIRALVRDDLLNEVTRTHAIHLTGVIVIPDTPTPTPGFPARTSRPRRRRPAPVVVTSRARARVRTRSIAGAGPPRSKPAIAVLSYAHRMSAELADSSIAGVSIISITHAAVPVARASSRTVSRATIHRRDGDDLEALAALGLI